MDLLEAIREFNEDKMKEVLAKGKIKVNDTIRDTKKRIEVTPLVEACGLGSLKIVKLLYDNKADVNKAVQDRKYKETPLYRAASKGWLEIVIFLVNCGARVNKKIYHNGNTPLHAAVAKDHVDIVKYLISKKANVNLTSIYGTPLFEATAYGRETECAKLLLENDAIVDKRPQMFQKSSPERPTPFFNCIKHDKVDMMELFLSYGADISFQYNGMTGICRAVSDQKYNALEFLLKKKCDPNLTNHSYTPLGIASKKGDPEAAELLLAYGADVNKPSSSCASKTPLMLAAKIKNYDSMEVLLEKGAAVNTQNKEGNTALHLLAFDFWDIKNVHMESMELLLKFKADPNVKNHDNVTPFYIIMRNVFNKHSMDKVLLELFLNSGADPNLEDENAESALFHLYHFETDIYEVLLKYGADVNKQNIDGQTVLHLLCKHHPTCEDKVTFLLDHGAKILKNKNGEMPYHLTSSVRVIQLFIDKGVEFNDQTNDGDTVLHRLSRNPPLHHGAFQDSALFALARTRKNEILTALLERTTVDKSIKNKAGQTAMDIAKLIGDNTVKTILKETSHPSSLNSTPGSSRTSSPTSFLRIPQLWGSLPSSTLSLQNTNGLPPSSPRVEIRKSSTRPSSPTSTTGKSGSSVRKHSVFTFNWIGSEKYNNTSTDNTGGHSVNNSEPSSPATSGAAAKRKLSIQSIYDNIQTSPATTRAKLIKASKLSLLASTSSFRRSISEDSADIAENGTNIPNNDINATGLLERKQYDVSISYDWDHREIVFKIRDYLEKHGDLKIWINVDDNTKSTNINDITMDTDNDTTKIDQSYVFVMCLSDKYAESAKNKKEYLCADRTRKRIVPVKVQTGFEANYGTVLHAIIKGVSFYDVDKYFDKEMPKLLQDLKKRVKDAMREEAGEVVGTDLNKVVKKVRVNSKWNVRSPRY